MKVLVVDNNKQTLKYLSDILEKEGLNTIQAICGNDALLEYKSEKPDFICLDIVMPDMSGYDVCREIRRTDSNIPIIFLSSKSETFDKILGLELGADDYIVKPFDVGELLARIRAIARRCLSRKKPNQIDESFIIGDLEVLPNQLRAKRGETLIELSLREIKILNLLHQKANLIVTRDDLLDYCWGTHIMTESRTVDLHISKLRKRIEKDHKTPQIILTVHGVGYRYEEC